MNVKEKTNEKNIILLVILCLFLSGCNNEFAKKEYDSVEKIIQKEDRYAKENSLFHSIEGGYELIVSKFDGRETLWANTIEENQNMEIEVSFSLSKGQAKLVHIDEEENVTTIIECLPDSSTDGLIAKTISLKSGKNRLKIVGYDCEDIELKMLFKEP